jgi:hypothetical protein
MDACACLAAVGAASALGVGWLTCRARRVQRSVPESSGWLDGAVFASGDGEAG